VAGATEELRPDSFAALVQRWSAGDEAATDALLRRVLPGIHGYARAQLGAALRLKDDSQDIVQEAALEFLRYGQRFELADEAAFRALLARIVRNVLSDRHAWFTRKRRDMHREQKQHGPSSVRLDAPAPATDPASRAGRGEHLDLVRLALELMPPLDRDIVVRHQFDGETFEAIAAAQGMQADAVRKRFHRALPRLSAEVRRLQEGRFLDEPSGR
jgi:RNA polymerase sigma factor (sigma-70 family)